MSRENDRPPPSAEEVFSVLPIARSIFEFSRGSGAAGALAATNREMSKLVRATPLAGAEFASDRAAAALLREWRAAVDLNFPGLRVGGDQAAFLRKVLGAEDAREALLAGARLVAMRRPKFDRVVADGSSAVVGLSGTTVPDQVLVAPDFWGVHATSWAGHVLGAQDGRGASLGAVLHRHTSRVPVLVEFDVFREGNHAYSPARAVFESVRHEIQKTPTPGVGHRSSWRADTGVAAACMDASEHAWRVFARAVFEREDIFARALPLGLVEQMFACAAIVTGLSGVLSGHEGRCAGRAWEHAVMWLSRTFDGDFTAAADSPFIRARGMVGEFQELMQDIARRSLARCENAAAAQRALCERFGAWRSGFLLPMVGAVVSVMIGLADGRGAPTEVALSFSAHVQRTAVSLVELASRAVATRKRGAPEEDVFRSVSADVRVLLGERSEPVDPRAATLRRMTSAASKPAVCGFRWAFVRAFNRVVRANLRVRALCTLEGDPSLEISPSSLLACWAEPLVFASLTEMPRVQPALAATAAAMSMLAAAEEILERARRFGRVPSLLNPRWRLRVAKMTGVLPSDVGRFPSGLCFRRGAVEESSGEVALPAPVAVSEVVRVLQGEGRREGGGRAGDEEVGLVAFAAKTGRAMAASGALGLFLEDASVGRAMRDLFFEAAHPSRRRRRGLASILCQAVALTWSPIKGRSSAFDSDGSALRAFEGALARWGSGR